MTEPIQSSNPGLPIGPPVEPVDGMAAPARQPLTGKIVSLRPLDAARDAEALFRQHMIYKGRNRDTAWFAMLDHQWPAIKKKWKGGCTATSRISRCTN